MHIPDGFVTAPVAAAGWAISAGGVGYAVRRTGRELKEKQVPLMGVLAAFIFAGQMLNFPVMGGTSGHLIGAAGAMETAICTLVIQNGIIPPTINLDNQDSECDLDYVPNTAREAEVNATLSNSFGFGGHNSVLILKKYSEG